MRPRQPLPRLWMMTDERQGSALLAAVRRLPRGSGIVFRHYSLLDAERRRVFEQVRRVARLRGHMLSLAGPEGLALRWQADASHGPDRQRGLLPRTMSAHGLAEIRAAERAGASLLFLSPIFPTRSHPGTRTLGPMRFNRLAQMTRLPVVALGGVDPRRAVRLRGHGWAAIDALTRAKGG